MGKSLTLNTGIGWMDLWGEGWLDEEALWEKIGNFADYFHNSLHKQKSVTAPDVIAIIDEKSLLHIQKERAIFVYSPMECATSCSVRAYRMASTYRKM